MSQWTTVAKAQTGVHGAWTYKADSSGVWVWPTRHARRTISLAAALDLGVIEYEDGPRQMGDNPTYTEEFWEIPKEYYDELETLADRLEKDGLF